MRFLLAMFLGFVLLDRAIGGDEVKPVNLEKLNTEADEEDPAPTSDSLGLFYASKTKKNYDVYLSRRASTRVPFGRAKPFLADRGADVRSPFQHLTKYYFASNEVPDEKFKNLKNFDIFMQIGNQTPTRVLGDINSKEDEMYPCIPPGGKEFYYSRMTTEGWKLLVANGPTPGPIGKSRPVGFPAGFHRAAVVGLTMYLQGPLEGDRIGLFHSKRVKVGGEWSKPEPVTALNHPDSKKGDMQPALTIDGARLYFVSDRPGGKGGLDIWFVQTAQLK